MTLQSEDQHNFKVADNHEATLGATCNLLLRNWRNVLSFIARNASYDLGILLSGELVNFPEAKRIKNP